MFARVGMVRGYVCFYRRVFVFMGDIRFYFVFVECMYVFSRLESDIGV